MRVFRNYKSRHKYLDFLRDRYFREKRMSVVFSHMVIKTECGWFSGADYHGNKAKEAKESFNTKKFFWMKKI